MAAEQQAVNGGGASPNGRDSLVSSTSSGYRYICGDDDDNDEDDDDDHDNDTDDNEDDDDNDGGSGVDFVRY